MKPNRLVAAVLVLAAAGAVGCSKRSDAGKAKHTTKEPVAVTKPVEGRHQPQAVREGDEGFVLPVKGTGIVSSSFGDGEAAYQAKQYYEATKIFESYTERKPGNAWGHYMLGLSAWKSGDYPKAEQAFDKALTIDPHHVKSLVNAARLHIDQKRHDDAIGKLTLATEIDPGSAEVHRLLARTYAIQGKSDEAVTAYQHALELNENDVWSMNNLALLYIETKHAEDALPLLLKAVELRPRVAEFHNNLGMALEHTGSFRAAGEAYSDALLVDPHYQKAKDNLSRVAAVKSGTEVQ